MMKALIKCVILWMFSVISIKAFLYDDFAHGLRCKGFSLLCPPMCSKLDPNGCIVCDCQNINPANPGNPFMPNTHAPNSGTLSGGTTFTKVPVVSTPSQSTMTPTTEPPNFISTAQPSVQPKYTPITNASSISPSVVQTSTTSSTSVSSSQSVTSAMTSSTTSQAAFVCPGVFSCSLDCLAGYLMDKDGCPKCQCAPIPTGLP